MRRAQVRPFKSQVRVSLSRVVVVSLETPRARTQLVINGIQAYPALCMDALAERPEVIRELAPRPIVGLELWCGPWQLRLDHLNPVGTHGLTFIFGPAYGRRTSASSVKLIPGESSGASKAKLANVCGALLNLTSRKRTS
jgi:hypothetical protein